MSGFAAARSFFGMAREESPPPPPDFDTAYACYTQLMFPPSEEGARFSLSDDDGETQWSDDPYFCFTGVLNYLEHTRQGVAVFGCQSPKAFIERVELALDKRLSQKIRDLFSSPAVGEIYKAPANEARKTDEWRAWMGAQMSAEARKAPVTRLQATRAAVRGFLVRLSPAQESTHLVRSGQTKTGAA